jgi:hypothetical protein
MSGAAVFTLLRRATSISVLRASRNSANIPVSRTSSPSQGLGTPAFVVLSISSVVRGNYLRIYARSLETCNKLTVSRSYRPLVLRRMAEISALPALTGQLTNVQRGHRMSVLSRSTCRRSLPAPAKVMPRTASACNAFKHLTACLV